MKFLRSILAIVVGLILAIAAIAAIKISVSLYPMPEGLDTKDPAALNAWIATLPMGAFLLVLLSYATGAFIGGGLAALIAGQARYVHAGIVGTILLILTIMNFYQFKHPDWMIIAGLLVPLPMSLLAGKLVSPKSTPALVGHP